MKLHFPVKRSLVVLLFLNELYIAIGNHSKFKTRRNSTFAVARRTKFIDNFIGLADLPNVHSVHELRKRTSIVDGGVFVPHKSTMIVYKSRLVPVTYGFVIKKETLKEYPALLRLGVKMMDKAQSVADKGYFKPKSICSKGSKVLLKLLNNLSQDIIKIKEKLLPEEERHESGRKGKMERTLNIKKKTTKNHLPKAWYLYCKRHKKQCSLLYCKRHKKQCSLLYCKRHKKQCSLILKKHRNNGLMHRNRKKRLRKKKRHCARCKVQVKKHRNRHHQRTKG